MICAFILRQRFVYLFDRCIWWDLRDTPATQPRRWRSLHQSFGHGGVHHKSQLTTWATRSFTPWPALHVMLWPLALMCILTHPSCLCKRLLRSKGHLKLLYSKKQTFAGTWLAMHSNNHIIIHIIHSPCQREEVKLFKRMLSEDLCSYHNTAPKASRGMWGYSGIAVCVH